MLVPLSWLNDYVDINVSADELEKKLFDCGFEVEEKWPQIRPSLSSHRHKGHLSDKPEAGFCAALVDRKSVV